jgi:2-oxoglutarate dehydrogenase E1 component
MTLPHAWNIEYIEAQYQKWQAAPESVSREWQYFFQGFELAHAKAAEVPPVGDRDAGDGAEKVQALIARYRNLGHLMACLDPLVACPTHHPLLDLNAFGLTRDDLDREFRAPESFGGGRMPLREMIALLQETYCRAIGVEYNHIQDPAERDWLIERLESGGRLLQVGDEDKERILEKLYQAALFEQFLNRKYVGVTRFSLEGGDALIPALDVLTDRAAHLGAREIILGMAHRGRLNVQCNILQKPLDELFGEFENCYDPEELFGAGDVKYHNGYLADIRTGSGHRLRILLMNNPSHLEAVTPVVEGFARARQDAGGEDRHPHVLPLLIHGDAAFAGQGVVAETLNLSQLKGYRTGGTIHLVINNQIGYTTLPEHARSTRYSTDMAKMLMVPIFHVHGENPEAVVRVIKLAADYRWKFHKDVVVDLVCYRRYGHNEGDEPYFTQPQMYERIRERSPLHELYAEKLLEEKRLDPQRLEQLETGITRRLEEAYARVHGSECPFPEARFFEEWEPYSGSYSHRGPVTAVDRETLAALADKLTRPPPDFNLNDKLAKLMEKRRDAVSAGKGIDWANAESLAFASLVTEGHPVRLSGQDSGRGTFSQRHGVLVDVENGRRFVPLQSLDDKQAPFFAYDSPLSEYGVLGFEYGYAGARPHALTMWEAQFGDFANNAQSVIDLFIVSGEAKWQRLNALVLLLPHGFEGLGPEHSSARLERFLQLCAGDNIQVCYPTTPAQYFHLLRRQVKSDFRKPLIVMTPKSLLRHSEAVSTIDDLSGGRFQTVLGDPGAAAKPQKVVFCSGKIYYELIRRRRELKRDDPAVIRLEQFYPFPEEQLRKICKPFRRVKKWLWVQEEPENMGGWQFVQSRLEGIVGRVPSYVGRPPAASPASGFPAVFRQQQAAIIDTAIGAKPQKSQDAA